ncbi:hypothetical protein EHW99_1551 [Erwinia amylovora]|uniref:Uncharacterized protein n=2 Tax=Erwinia amylovora TaxID=552 RepID=A0A831A231_ERWAM|nr:hypothetical protein EaACW_2047 [Erwinia amylovora ACW56400]QJQ54255.1 hypothetical protein EHX00_1551 [Erwinia amylovora]CBA20985.1 hypothetical protein predicted by Glimmer/Critica [Erwinia amylovora CFBP1430]CCO78893.1 hypothetical protein BN432_2097 [Erwinia amylovora Ea356]CCO82691.1 hypothetical protein BN433_2122 [Erwinia amylovora Ea266]CCO86471.1 hypothetical protein BN434_2085 [Erwinia amylovora CFBP 2585]CCO90258.1 hypothetical protein BN435_2089 [Erwinia amylovora 01SFR-BO]CCO
MSRALKVGVLAGVVTWYFKDRPAPEEFQPTINSKAYKD